MTEKAVTERESDQIASLVNSWYKDFNWLAVLKSQCTSSSSCSQKSLGTTLRCDRDAACSIGYSENWSVDEKLCFQLSVHSKLELDCIENTALKN